MKNLDGIRIITITYDSQAPDVFVRTRPDATVWSKICFTPYIEDDAYIIESNYTDEDIFDHLPEEDENNPFMSVDYTPFV